MRQSVTSLSPSLSLHRIAAIMLGGGPARGRGSGRGRGRDRRAFSDLRPPPPGVSGDTHFQSVRRTNAAFNANANDYRSVPFNYSNSNSNNNGGNNRTYNNNSYNNYNGGTRGNYGGKNGEFRQPSRRSNQPAAVRPKRSRPADYRLWEYAKVPPPPNCERFVVLSYNILADYLANSHRNLYYHVPRRFMSWDWRKGNILVELGWWSPDILCFQEVDKFQELEEELRLRGYTGIWKMRTGMAIDGCATLWRASRFKLVYEECIEFNKHGMRDNVAQICVLESQLQNYPGKKLSIGADVPNRVVICNIHVLYNPRRGEIKLGQVRVLLQQALAASKKWDDAPVVLCGDFNCTPKSPLYNFLVEQKLDVSEIGRDKVSGQASAEIRLPPTQNGHYTGVQSTGDAPSLKSVQNDIDDKRQSDALDAQNASASISVPADNSLSPSNESLLDMSNKSRSESFNSSLTTEKGSVKTFRGVGDLSEAENLPYNLRDNQRSSVDKIADNIRSISASQSPPEIEHDQELSSSVYPSKKDTSPGFPFDIGNNCNLNTPIFQSDQSTVTSSGPVDEHMHSLSGDLISGVVAMPASIGNSETNDQKTSLRSENDTDDMLVGLSLHERDETLELNVGFDEDAEKNMSQSDAFPSDFGNVFLKDIDKTPYNPSLWTPMEIATATGNSSSTVLEHPLKLKSTYSEVQDSSGTRDSNGEPLVTSYNSCFMGTVDYIWRSEGLCTVRVLAPIPKNVMQPTGGFPTKKWGSDHIALVSELAFTKVENDNVQAG